jgi:diguanylate cyclase (GGDEF)-like protein
MIKHYLGLLQSNWRVVAVIALLACILSVLISLTTTPIYRATTSFIIFPTENLTSSRDVVSSLDTLEQRSVITTYAEIMSSERVYLNTQDEMGAGTVAFGQFHRSVAIQPESNIFFLNVDGPDHLMAAVLANQVGVQGIDLINSFYEVFDIEILDEATPATEPLEPRPVRSLLYFALGGLVLGIVVVIANYQVSRPLEAIRERLNSDPESGAYKRAHFSTLVERRLAEAPNAPLSLGLIELESLKDFANALPNVVLTDLLHDVTEILKQQLRGNDAVGRWNEASFAIMLQDTPPRPAARTLIRIRQALLAPMQDDSRLYNVELKPSVGLTARENDETLSQLFENLEFALEKANQATDRIFIYPVTLGEERPRE